MDEQKKILKLAAQIACMDLEGLEDSYRNRLRILDSQIEALRELEQSYRAKLTDMDELLNRFGAICQVCSRLNILCTNTGEKKDQGPHDEKDINKTLTNWH